MRALHRNLLRVTTATAALATVLACGQRSADDEFNSFLARADRTPAEIERPAGEGIVTDISGKYLFNIDLGGAGIGDVTLELTCTFSNYRPVEEGSELAEAGVAALIDGALRFPDDPDNATPLAVFTDVPYQANGTLDLDVGYVRLEPERSPIENTAVETQFILQSIVVSERELCGIVDDDTSAVVLPIQIPLRGVTYGAKRYGPDGEIPVNVPTRCPRPTAPPIDDDVGVPDDTDLPDVGPDSETGVDDGPIPPTTDRVGQRADISGTWWMSVGVAGGALNLDFLAEMAYFEDDDAAQVIGALRITVFPAGTPAAGTFSVPVDENGRFFVVIRDLVAPSRLGEVNADIALTGVIDNEDFFCGFAAGQTYSPIRVNLRGTTFGAIRVDENFGQPPFEEGPPGAINRCPDPT